MTSTAWPSIFRPLQVGTISLDHRLVVPPHGGGAGSLLGPEDQFEQHCAFWLLEGGRRHAVGGRRPDVRAQPAAAGLRAHRRGCLRPRPVPLPELRPAPRRAGPAGPCRRRLPLHADGAAGRHAARRLARGQRLQRPPHPPRPRPRRGGVARARVRRVGRAGRRGRRATPSSCTPTTTTCCSGSSRRSPTAAPTATAASFEGRRRLLREVVESIREHVSRPITLGLRLCIDEMIEGGYGLDECQAVIAAFTAEGTVDYFSLDVGNNWGVPSYIPVGSHEEGEWAPLCGQAKTGHDLARRLCRPGHQARHGREHPGRRARPTSWPWPGRSWPTLSWWPRSRPTGRSPSGPASA